MDKSTTPQSQAEKPADTNVSPSADKSAEESSDRGPFRLFGGQEELDFGAE